MSLPARQVQAINVILVTPFVLLVNVIFSFVLWPPLAPYVVWIPVLGPAIGGAAAVHVFSEGPSGALTRRLEHVRATVEGSGETWNLAPVVAAL